MCGSPAAVHIAVGAIEPRGLVEQGHERRGLEVTAAVPAAPRISSLLQHERQPADLELGAGRDDEVCVSRARDEAGLRLDVMRILRAVVAT